MPLSGLVINRVHTSALDDLAERALSLAEDLDAEPAVEVEALRRHADLMRVIETEKPLLERFAAARPTVAQTLVQALPTDVTDLDGAPPRRRAAGREGLSARRRAAEPPAGSALPTRSELQEVTSVRCRSSSRRSRSVIPPQTPHSIRLSSASARHSKRTGQPEHSSGPASDRMLPETGRPPCPGTWRAWSSLHVALQSRCDLPFVKLRRPGISPAHVARRYRHATNALCR